MDINKLKKSETLDVYGLDHSPWVQSILLSLYDNKLNYNIRTIPTLSLLSKSGVMMPAIRIGDSQWKLDSMEILLSLGYDPIPSSEKKLIFRTWQGVQHRVDNPLKFFYYFSLCRGFNKNKIFNLISHALRPIITIYFFTLLNIIKIKIKSFNSNENFLDQYTYWNNKLSQQGTKFFGGDVLNIIDYQLFGVIQSHCSIPFLPLIETLQKNQELDYLRKWISNMQFKFVDYPHLYSANYFDPVQPNIERASIIERTIYWLGLITMLILLPVTVIILLFLFSKRK
jgi:hypothetical protein